ncbi:hypothetical protein ACHHYP_16370 [Achlya hypogyna]|uniref:Uncharacterized protein n=1 Tax=Achlya hypogyna TaxID=1202772 RepID=A0A1V9Y8Z9_ACHHY|nr:hypothetical protein ACHHYP_16370 [Achlya hypogyna]
MSPQHTTTRLATTAIETNVPVVLSFELPFHTAMVIHDTNKHRATVVESRFLLSGAEYIELELVTVAKAPLVASGLYFGATVHVASRHTTSRRYLAGHSFQRELRWSSRRSTKSAFRIVSLDGRSGPLELDDAFCLQSVHWPAFYASFSRKGPAHCLGSLVLARGLVSATPLRATNALHRETSLSLLRQPQQDIHDGVPTVYVSEDSFDTDIEPDEEVGEALYVIAPPRIGTTQYSSRYTERGPRDDPPQVAYRADWRQRSMPSCTA